MPIAETNAEEVVEALNEAANTAVEWAKADEDQAWQAFRRSRWTALHGVNVGDENYRRYRSFQCAQANITSCTNALAGLIWLAAGEHERGIA